MGEAITGDGEGTEEERKEGRYPPHVKSPPTFPLWLCTPILITISYSYSMIRRQ